MMVFVIFQVSSSAESEKDTTATISAEFNDNCPFCYFVVWDKLE